MKKLFTIIGSIIIALTLVNFQCNENIVEPRPGNPPGYQEDIPWPSLADSPWPMYHHDPQNTGRSEFVGSLIGNLYGYIPAHNMEGALIIGYDSTVYFLTTSPQNLTATDYSGKINWLSEAIGYSGSQTPIMSKDSIIYVASQFDTVYAFKNTGDVEWKFKTDNGINQLSVNIDLEGNLYFVDASGNLYCLTPEGNLKWKLQDSRFNSDFYSLPVFSPDGNTIYILGKDPSLIAIDINNHKVKWTFSSSISMSSPVVDSQGNIYLLEDGQADSLHKLISVKPNGTMRWVFEFIGIGENLNIEPTIDKNGNIFFGTNIIYSLSHDGTLRWKLELPDAYSNTCALISDLSGNVFIGAARNLGEIRFFSISNTGEIVWTLELLIPDRSPNLSPAISAEGLLFYPTFRSENIIVIK